MPSPEKLCIDTSETIPSIHCVGRTLWYFWVNFAVIVQYFESSYTNLCYRIIQRDETLLCNLPKLGFKYKHL